jgi:hypothetical protein
MRRWNLTAAGVAILALECSTAVPGGPPVSSFTLTTGATQLTLANLIGQRLGPNGGSGDLKTLAGGPGQLDHLFQNFFWYRGPGDSREYALSTMVGSSPIQSNQVHLIYEEPINNGATAGALSFFITYTLNEMPMVFGQPHALLRIDLTVQNNTAGNITVNVFSYNDLDLNGSSAGDTVLVGSVNNRYVQVIRDSGLTRAQASYVGSPAAFTHFQVGTFPSVRDVLSNASANTLSDSPLSLGPGDYSGAMQWTMTLGTGAQSQGHLSVALDVLVSPCPADLTSDGAVGPADLGQLLSSWGACPP